MTRLIIAGAGIAGLTLGHALLKYAPQVQFTILERASALRAAGAGIILAPNAIPLLDDLGLREPLRDIGKFLPYNQLTDATGRPWQKLPGPTDQLLAFHRAELMQLLQEKLRPHLQFSSTVQSVSQKGNTVHVQTDVGLESCDLLVGADGLYSKVRQSCGGLKPQYAGYTSWRTVIHNAPPVPGASEMWGHGRRLGLVPLTGGRMYVYFTLNAPAAMSRKATAQDLQQLFSEFNGADHGVLDRLDDTTPLIHTDIHDLPRPDWGKGRVLLMGDAAHALTPNLGQGAGMGIEDAVVMARCLREHPAIEQATAAFRRLRQARVQKVMLASRMIGRVGQLQHPLAVQFRDGLMSRGPAQTVPDWLWTPVARASP